MGDAFVGQYLKEEGLKDFTEIANFLENGLMQRMIEDDEEDHEEADAKAADPQIYTMTEGACCRLETRQVYGP
eukprot:1495915-Heterocapsa_arctica.AAC.1